MAVCLKASLPQRGGSKIFYFTLKPSALQRGGTSYGSFKATFPLELRFNQVAKLLNLNSRVGKNGIRTRGVG